MLRSLVLLGLACALLGCGKSAPTVPTDATPEPPPLPANRVAVHEMDPAKQVVPTDPAAGMLGGRAFKPDRVSLEGKSLTFRQGTGFFPDLQIQFFFADYKPTDSVKMIVTPSQKWFDGKVPSLQVSIRKGADALPNVEFVNDGYALTLELQPRRDGKVSGSLHLSLAGDEKSFLAGTFIAVYERELNDPPEPEDRPYIAGRLEHLGKKDQILHFRCSGLPTGGGDTLTDSVSSKVGQGNFFAARSTTSAPRVTSLRQGKSGEEFDCTRLPPGKYFLVARLDDGPSGWKLVDVAADSANDAPLTIPGGVCGHAEVAVPPGSTGQVQAIPAGLKLDDPTGIFTTAISGSLGSFGNVADGKATLKNLTPGKYDVVLRSGTTTLRGEMTVAPGQTAKVELK